MNSTTMGSGFVVMAVYRPNPVLLKRQVESLRAQTVTDWRCLVGIDGPDPATLAILHELAGDDSRFDVREYPDNVGVYRHFERLLYEIKLGTGWFALADQDDEWYPEKLSRLLNVLNRPGVSAATGQARLVDEAGNDLGLTRRRPGDVVQTIVRNQVTGSLTVFDREVLENAFPFPPATDIAIHDHWLGVCAALIGRIGLCDEAVQDYVQHGGNVLGEVRPKRASDTWRGIVQFGGIRAYLDHVSTHHWGWRVSMATSILERGAPAADLRPVRSFSRGRLSWSTFKAVMLNVVQGRFPVKAAVGMLAASYWWPRSKGVPAA